MANVCVCVYVCCGRGCFLFDCFSFLVGLVMQNMKEGASDRAPERGSVAKSVANNVDDGTHIRFRRRCRLKKKVPEPLDETNQPFPKEIPFVDPGPAPAYTIHGLAPSHSTNKLAKLVLVAVGVT
jgi:hypothetical protein